jgi:hypothetical protein
VISDSDATHLECVEQASFSPIGWLYRGVFDALLERGLVTMTVSGGYIISDYGAAELAQWRNRG